MSKEAATNLEPTRQFWSQKARTELTLEDAREIRENLTGLAQVLLDIQRRVRSETVGGGVASPAPSTKPAPSVKPRTRRRKRRTGRPK